MSILQDIYDNKYTPGKAQDRLPFSLRLRGREIYEALDEEFIERYWDDLCKIGSYRDFANFREGFRLGVSLMLEMR